MIVVDWPMLGLGALAGAIAAALFFAGLAWGMRLALRQTTRPTPVLLLSGAIRIATLLGIGWLVAEQGPAALAGFVVAFLIVRFAILALARPTKSQDSASQGAAPWS